MKNIDSDLIRGNIDTIILTTMLEGDKYGLDIIKEVEIRSNGTYELKQPTLYSCLKRLENQELISSYWLDSDIGGRRHYYKLTEKGKESLLQKQEEWAKSKFIIDNLLSNHNYDEYRLVKKEDYDKIIEGKQFDYSSAKQNSEEIIDNEDLSNFENDETVESETDETPSPSYENNDEENQSEDGEYSEADDSEKSYYVDMDHAETESRINYNDENEDVEADYPNQKRFKIPSIYDSIKIDDENYNSVNENDIDSNDEFTSSIYSENNLNDFEDETETTSFENLDDIDLDEDYNDETFEDEADEDNIEETSSFDEYLLGNESEDETNDDVDDRIYFSNTTQDDQNDDSDLDIPTNTRTDQGQNELNILSRLRMQEDEEINEYIGDKNSYVNHLNKSSDKQNLDNDDLNVIQEDLFITNNYLSQKSISNKIDEFASAVKELNKFNSYNENDDSNSKSFDELEDFEDESQEIEHSAEFDDSTTIEDELITNINSQEESKNIIDFKQNDINDDDYLSELNELKQTENHGFFNSLDSAEYIQNSNVEPVVLHTFDSLEDFEDTKHSDPAFEKQLEDYNNQYGYNQPSKTNIDSSFDDASNFEELEESYESVGFENEDNNENISDSAENYSLSSFDEIISQNVNNYTNETTKFMSSNNLQPFTPRFTENNYKQKLNNLSAYSKVNSEEPENQNPQPSEDIMNKVKDIQTLKSEFENEGIVVKEFKKSNGHDDVDRNYLLVNKINLIKSLILLFGYVFVLSAVYIIMNNTSAQTIHNFSFKYFLYGFIPFGIYSLIYLFIYILNPYKKTPAKFAPRIMIFISIIITIQLLLITYCVNLQLGFYSFSQNYYNHLIWVIPTIISFAPIISTLIYMALYYSKNFNV